MPNESFLHICPYFIKTLGNKLFCEAIFDDKELVSAGEHFYRHDFNSSTESRAYQKKYCASFDYKECYCAYLNEVNLKK